MMDEESEDSNFLAYIVIIIMIILLSFLFRNQIVTFYNWLFNLL